MVTEDMQGITILDLLLMGIQKDLISSLKQVLKVFKFFGF